MTPNEIKEEVAAIAQENSLNVNEAIFYSSLNRAFETVNRLRPKTKTVDIYNTSLVKTVDIDTAVKITQEHPFSTTAPNTQTVCLTATGRGIIVLTAGEKEILREELEAPDSEAVKAYVVKNLIGEDKATLDIRIEGDPFVMLTAMTAYGERYSDDPEDVPRPGIYNIVNLRRLAPDYVRIKEIERIDTAGEQIVDEQLYTIAATDELWLLRSMPGRYRITYSYRLQHLSVGNADENIGMDSDLYQALILLTAYYVWYEDITPLAEHCYASYLQTVSELKTEARASKDPSFKNVYGW